MLYHLLSFHYLLLRRLHGRSHTDLVVTNLFTNCCSDLKCIILWNAELKLTWNITSSWFCILRTLINLSSIDKRGIPPLKRNNNLITWHWSCFDRQTRQGWKQMICHTTKTKEQCHIPYRQAVFNPASKKYCCKRNILARAWLSSQASQ